MRIIDLMSTRDDAIINTLAADIADPEERGKYIKELKAKFNEGSAGWLSEEIAVYYGAHAEEAREKIRTLDI